MQSRSQDWICDCRLAFDWFTCPEATKDKFPWEAAQEDICRRCHDESEGRMTLAKMQGVIGRTFDAFVNAYGDGWLLDLSYMLHCEFCYIVGCVMMVCHELRFEHLSPVLEMASQDGFIESACAAAKVGKVLHSLLCLCFDLQASFIACIVNSFLCLCRLVQHLLFQMSQQSSLSMQRPWVVEVAMHTGFSCQKGSTMADLFVEDIVASMQGLSMDASDASDAFVHKRRSSSIICQEFFARGGRWPATVAEG